MFFLISIVRNCLSFLLDAILLNSFKAAEEGFFLCKICMCSHERESCERNVLLLYPFIDCFGYPLYEKDLTLVVLCLAMKNLNL